MVRSESAEEEMVEDNALESNNLDVEGWCLSVDPYVRLLLENSKLICSLLSLFARWHALAINFSLSSKSHFFL